MINSFNKETYRYGFQGQEKDDEWKGSGNSINYKYRVHDPRIGRFLSIDPLAPKFSHNSPYAFSENSTIAFVELEGLEKVRFGYKGTTVDISNMTAEEVVALARSYGFNFDPNWINKDAQKELWLLTHTYNPERNNSGTKIMKLCSESDKNEYGGGNYYFTDTERTFGQWRAAKDDELRDWWEGTKLIVNTGFVIISGGGALVEGGLIKVGGFMIDMAITSDDFTKIGNEFSIMEGFTMDEYGEEATKWLQTAKTLKSVYNISKGTVTISGGLAGGDKFELIYNLADKSWTTTEMVIDSNDK